MINLSEEIDESVVATITMGKNNQMQEKGERIWRHIKER